MKECYAVFIGFGQYEDYYADLKFVTFSKEIAENWVNKYNKIVENNYERLVNFDNENDLKIEPLYYDEIVYEEVRAFFKTTKFRFITDLIRNDITKDKAIDKIVSLFNINKFEDNNKKEPKYQVGDKVIVCKDLKTKIEKIEFSEKYQDYIYWFKDSVGTLCYELEYAIEINY